MYIICLAVGFLNGVLRRSSSAKLKHVCTRWRWPISTSMYRCLRTCVQLAVHGETTKYKLTQYMHMHERDMLCCPCIRFSAMHENQARVFLEEISWWYIIWSLRYILHAWSIYIIEVVVNETWVIWVDFIWSIYKGKVSGRFIFYSIYYHFRI